MTDNINEVRERLERAAETLERGWRIGGNGEAGDLRVLLANHARLQAMADPWRGLYDSGRMPKLDGVDDWAATHPDLPQWPDDEERALDPLLAIQGFEARVVLDDYRDDDQGDFDHCAWLAKWEPEPPSGDGWRLVAVTDSEDGPAAWFVRPLATAVQP